jgi:polyisoprenoid-binding protein YceI
MRARVSVLTAALLLASSAAAASPTMVRLGYAGCVPCHLSPQGGGLLTDYGRRVDAAQSLRVREYVPPDDAETRTVLQDVRLQIGVTQWIEGAPASGSTVSEARVWHRLAVTPARRHRFMSTVGLDSRPMAGAAVLDHVAISRLTWDFQPREGLEITVGKDTLPTGVMMGDYEQLLRERAEVGRSVYPAQARLTYWSDRLQLTSYAFAPGGEETADRRQRGGGVVAGAVFFRHRGIAGVTARRSTGGVVGSDVVGGYARLGFGRWGVFAEHDAIGQRGAVTSTAGHAASRRSDDRLRRGAGVARDLAERAARTVRRGWRLAAAGACRARRPGSPLGQDDRDRVRTRRRWGRAARPQRQRAGVCEEREVTSQVVPMSRRASLVACVITAALLAPPEAWADDHFAIGSGRVVVSCVLTVGGGFDARTENIDGALMLAESGQGAGRIAVDLATLRTGIALRDRHLRHNYLEIGRGPAFRHAVIEDIRLDRSANAFSGLLSLHGRQRLVTGQVTLRETGQAIRVEAVFTLKLPEFEIAPPRYLGVGIDDEVTVHVAFTTMRAETAGGGLEA